MSQAEEVPQTAAEAIENALSFAKRSFMYWRRFFVVFVLGCLASIPSVFMRKLVYRSETIVLYQENIKSEALTGSETAGDNARRVGARLREMLLSRASLEPIVYAFPRYSVIADERGLPDAVEELRKSITFKAKEGDTFEIGYEAPIPEEAKEVATRLADHIVQEAATQRQEQSQATKEYLEAQSRANKIKADQANAALSAFLSQHPEFVRFTLPGAPGAGAPGAARAAEEMAAPPAGVDPVLFQMEAEAQRIQRQLVGARSNARVESDETRAARRELAEKKQQVKENHPDLIAARRRLQAALDADARRPPPGALSPQD